jgi:Flp pilus assembly protein TadB
MTAGGAPTEQSRRGPRAGSTTRTMDDRERLQWLVAQARRGKSTSRANLWSITLLHASPLLAACLLALLLGRPEVAAATLALVLLTLGLVRTAVRPRRVMMAPARLRAVRYGR